MSLSIGIIGLPNVGKSTLFRAITKAAAESANYPFCTIEPNVGIVDVPDDRLFEIAELVKPNRIVPAQCKFVDIAGLVRGASKGEGLRNKFLANIREVAAIIHVVRCFDGEEVIHVSGMVDPLDDIETINLELVLADLETVEKRLDRLAKLKKSGDKLAQKEHEVLSKVHPYLIEGRRVTSLSLAEEELEILRGLSLLTAKDVLYVANTGEEQSDSSRAYLEKVKEVARQEGSEIIELSAKIEAELIDLSEEEQILFMEELGIEKTGLARMITTSYSLLGLLTYFTAGEKEVRAWTIKKDTKAPQAASVIHSDIERGFIRAEIVSYNDFIECGSLNASKDKGLMRLEGKDYIVQDGDIVHFRFAV